ncbi:ATP-binding protein [Haliangium sp.]|uniref:sensor histidine kinase n=1 Tax=Haliangium sp. TaxID=2663208 RepID=UPI003D12A101
MSPTKVSGTRHASPGPVSLRVLLLEDDPGYARLVREYLKDAQFSPRQLRTVATLDAARVELERDPPDVVIADLGLPDAAGDEVVPALRTAGPRVPIVILSGEDNLDRALESMQQGAQEFLVKGRSEDFFLGRAIRAAIERKRFEEFEQLLVGVVSHDLRGPLNTISATVEILEHEGIDNELTQIARLALQRARTLTDDLLDFTQLRLHGLLPITHERAEFAACVHTVVDGLRLACPGRTIDLEVDDDTTGWFDPARVSQVVSNLLTNAVQHSPDDTPVLVRCRATEDELDFEVHNRGEPIAGDMLCKLFQPLERLESRRTQPGSIGLGLYIADQIVRAHGGTVAVTSTAEHGTAFRVTLPREPTPDRGASPSPET